MKRTNGQPTYYDSLRHINYGLAKGIEYKANYLNLDTAYKSLWENYKDVMLENGRLRSQDIKNALEIDRLKHEFDWWDKFKYMAIGFVGGVVTFLIITITQ